MSRFIDQLPDGTYKQELDDPDKCKHMYNDVCCCEQSEHVADYPDDMDCKRCVFFEPEDME